MPDGLKLVKELREKTGAGFLDCKQVLKDNGNDIELAIDSLRKKGLAKASKKSSREAKEGALGVYTNKSQTIILKVNSETDFAAKSNTFLDFLDLLGNLAMDINDTKLNLDLFLNYKHNGKLISDLINEMIVKIGENIILNQIEVINHKENFVSFYVHNSYRKNIGKIISLIQYKADSCDDDIKKLSKNICMHIAALKPESIDKDGLSKNIIDREMSIQKELIADSGKPDNVVEKILEGKMKKFFSEITLMNQSFVLDPDKIVKEVIDTYTESHSYELLKFNLVTLN